MSNFIFISPNFPTNYWQFCRELKNDGMNVLGIGDQPYDELKPELKDSLNEYYKVGSLENYDEVYRAVAFFAFKYGRIDWLESNNEYWLERDAALRHGGRKEQDARGRDPPPDAAACPQRLEEEDITEQHPQRTAEDTRVFVPLYEPYVVREPVAQDQPRPREFADRIPVFRCDPPGNE